MTIDLDKLYKNLKQFEPPLVRLIEFSPGLLARMTDGMPSTISNKLFGIDVSSNAALPETHARLRLGDGRTAVWDLRDDKVYILPTPTATRTT
jgi:hypothetical protein